MFAEYRDILDAVRIGTGELPMWFDSNGTPRFGAFRPEMVPDIYADECALLEVGCQSCDNVFLVAIQRRANSFPMESSHRCFNPPRHTTCVAGDTMLAVERRVVEAWMRTDYGQWRRVPQLEIDLYDAVSDATGDN